MTFLLWLIGIWLAVTVFFRLFGKRIMAFGMKKLVNKLQHEAERQQKAYDANFGAGDMREHVYADGDVKVTSPKHHPKPEVHLEDFAQDVDFEEVNDR
ncbi:MAG: hypothetical protein NWR72_20675 [Bacteroidia bacterium]|nr:hypothetical protein [Bacteroidia bacterium]